MRQTVLLLVAVSVALLVTSGVALAQLSSLPDEGTVRVDGQVRAILTVGDRIYIGGDFTHVDGIRRNYLAAIDSTTGELDPTWNPGANDSVRAFAASADGSRIYAGGSFTSVGGTNRQRLAALDTVTGEVDGEWDVRVNSSVRALAVSGSRLYLGGAFTSVEGVSRTRLAMVEGPTGELNPNWTPTANSLVRALNINPEGARVYVGGDFTGVSGQSRRYLTSLDATTGALDNAFKPPNPNGKLFALALSGTRVYTAEGGSGGAAGAYDASTGARSWLVKGDGDVQAVSVLADKVYVAGHFEAFSGESRRVFAAVDAATGALDEQWTPSANPAYPGVWMLTSDDSLGRLYAGGDFTSISGQRHERFAQFSETGGEEVETRVATAAADAKIAEGAPNTNHGGATSLGADGDTGGGRDESSLIGWDLSGVAPGTEVGSATVTLRVTNASSQAYEAYALRRAWVEPEVTWNAYAAGLAWEVAGAKGSLDREATVAGSITPSSTGERSFALAPGLVQRWVDDPASNGGIVIADAANTNGFEFYSREASGADQRPRLTLTLESTSS